MSQRWLVCLALACLAPTGGALGQNAYTDGQSAVRDVFPQGGQELLDASEVQALPSFSDTPQERSFFNNPNGMTNAGQTALSGTDAPGIAYTRAISTNYLDPAATRTLLAAGLAVEADPLAVVGADVGLSGQYGACTDTAVYDTTLVSEAFSPVRRAAKRYRIQSFLGLFRGTFGRSNVPVRSRPVSQYGLSRAKTDMTSILQHVRLLHRVVSAAAFQRPVSPGLKLRAMASRVGRSITPHTLITIQTC